MNIELILEKIKSNLAKGENATFISICGCADTGKAILTIWISQLIILGLIVTYLLHAGSVL